MKRLIVVVIALGLLMIPGVSWAHPGNTDKYGCHTCRTNCPKWGLSTGEYHCHNAKALPQPKEPIRSHFGEDGGTTEPWPEYKSSLPSSASGAKQTSTSIPAAKSITYDLAKGMENNQVVLLQQILAKYPKIYPEGSVTGYFGPATEQAVKRFQKEHNLEQVGFTGPKTRALLNSIK